MILLIAHLLAVHFTRALRFEDKRLQPAAAAHGRYQRARRRAARAASLPRTHWLTPIARLNARRRGRIDLHIAALDLGEGIVFIPINEDAAR